MALGSAGWGDLMSPGSSMSGILPGPGSGPNILGGLGGILKGDYDPQNILMDKLGMKQPGWMKSMNAIRNMGGIGFSTGKGWFGMQPASNGSQNMLMSVLAQQMGQGRGQQASTGGPITVRNESALTPLGASGVARPVSPMQYRDAPPVPTAPLVPQEFNRLTPY